MTMNNGNYFKNKQIPHTESFLMNLVSRNAAMSFGDSEQKEKLVG